MALKFFGLVFVPWSWHGSINFALSPGIRCLGFEFHLSQPALLSGEGRAAAGAEEKMATKTTTTTRRDGRLDQ